MFIAVISYLPKLLKIKFYPSYSAFTFPIVISAVAMKQLNGYLVKIKQPIDMLKYLVKFQELIAIFIVIYVLVRYFKYMMLDDKIEKKAQINKTKIRPEVL